MVIIFGNQKGGAGKSTLAMLYANHQAMVEKQNVTVLDLDFQRSLFSRWEEDKAYENPELYEVLDLSLEDFPIIMDELEADPDQKIIIDLPGKIDDDALIPVIKNADVIVVPFHYDKMTYQATLLFTLFCKSDEINPNVKMVFVPNKTKSSVKYELKKGVNDELSNYGLVTKEIPDRVAFQRLTTRDIPTELMDIVDDVFSQI